MPNKPYFLLKQSTSEQWYFVLKAGNGETITTSEMYTTLQACKDGIESVKNCAPGAEIEYEHPPAG